MSDAPIIAIVDDDLAMREALQDLLRSCGYRARVFPSAEAYLRARDRAEIACMVLDVRMPGMSGLELQIMLVERGETLPIIFMTSYADDHTRAAALRGGARAVLGKPVDDEVLLKHLEAAVGNDSSP